MAQISRAERRNGGWHVCVNYTSNEDRAQEVASDVRSQGVKAAVVQADVSVPGEVEAMFDRTERELGPITGLVNNAGVATGIGPIEELDIDATRRMLDVNVFGLFVCCRCAVKRMSKRYGGQGGVIVNISSPRRGQHLRVAGWIMPQARRL